MKSQHSLNTEFGTDYKGAIQAWKKFENAPKSLEKTLNLIHQVEVLLGPVVHVHVLDSQHYIGIKFSERHKVISVWIHQNFVDHAVDLVGSLPLADKENVWRTQLTTSFSPSSKVNKPAEVNMVVCPKCGLQYNRNLPQCQDCS